MMGPAFLIERFLTDKIVQATSDMTGRPTASHIFAVASGIFAFVGTSFLIYAAHLWLKNHYAADTAALLTGVIIMAVSFCTLLISAGIIYFRKGVVRKIHHEVVESVEEVLQAIDDLLADPVRENPKISATAMTLAGFVAGKKFL